MKEPETAPFFFVGSGGGDILFVSKGNAIMTGKKKKIFEGRVFSVSTGKKVLPDKRKVYIEEVSHPGASLIVPLRGEGVVFIRQFRPVIDRYIWEIPAGTLSPGEAPADCARRELQEETGYTADSMRDLGYIFTTPGFCDEKISVFKAVCGKRKAVKRDEDELITVRTFSRTEIKKMLFNGRITDAKTIAALALAGIL
jgi:ADP-ribose pyrophosphatase